MNRSFLNSSVLVAFVLSASLLMSCSKDKPTEKIDDPAPQKTPPDKMLADYTEAIKLNPSDSIAYFRRGARHEALGETDLAISDYTEAIRLKEGNAYAKRAAMYKNRREHEKAIADYTEVIQFNASGTNDLGAALTRAANSARAYRDWGICYDEMGKHDKAMADYMEAIQVEPSLLDEDLKRRMGK